MFSAWQLVSHGSCCPEHRSVTYAKAYSRQLLPSFCLSIRSMLIKINFLAVAIRHNTSTSLKSRDTEVQGGSIKPLLRFKGRFFHIGVRFEDNSNMILIYVILTVYGKNSITNSACVAKILIFSQTSY